MRAVAPKRLMTEAEFRRLPETMTKVELLDGKVVVAPSPTYWHQELLGRLIAALRSWADEQTRPVIIGHAPLDVRFAPDRILQPDAFVLFGRLRATHRGPIERIPALCIEVLSDDRVHDRVAKRLMYAAAGVKELWIVDPAGAAERWIGRGLTTAERVGRRLESPLLPGFALELRKLFAGR
jgi:Uma2 family endonuclease